MGAGADMVTGRELQAAWATHFRGSSLNVDSRFRRDVHSGVEEWVDRGRQRAAGPRLPDIRQETWDSAVRRGRPGSAAGLETLGYAYYQAAGEIQTTFLRGIASEALQRAHIPSVCKISGR